MTTQQLLDAVILKATGEVSTNVFGDSESQKVLGIANFYITSWANEPDVDWNSLYTPENNIGTVTNASSFTLPTSVIKVSDKAGDTVRIDWTDGVGYTLFQIVPANELKRYYEGNRTSAYGHVCAQVGRSLSFDRVFKSTDSEFGGSITVPTYASPALLTASSDAVPVDNPNWLVLISAAEYVRNDITLQNQYPNLVAEANQAMQEMKDNNDTAEYQEIVRSPAGDGAGW